MSKVIFIIIFSITFSYQLVAQQAGITNPASNLIIDRYNTDTYITGSRTCTFDGWANPGNIGIKLYVNGSGKSFSCNNCGTWETTQTLDAGTNEIYIQSRKDFDAYVASSQRTVTFMKPLTDADFHLTDYPNDGYVKITWYKHTGTGTSSFNYRVYRNTINQSETGADWVLLGDWTQGTSFNDYPPTTGITYYYWVVCALDNSGSNPSAFATSRSIVHEQPAPATPVGLTATSISSSEIVLNWNISANATNYQIFTCGGSNIATELGTTYTLTNLTPNTYSEFKIRAGNNSGSSNFTICAGATTDLVIPMKPEKPTGENTLFENSSNTIYITTGADYADSYIWELIPIEAGTISGTGLSATVDWDDTFSGTAFVSVMGENSIGNSEKSDALTINIEAFSVNQTDIDFYNTANVTPNSVNPNNYINIDVPIRFKIAIHNELSQNLATATGTLTCTTSGVTITDNSVSYNNIASGVTAWSTDEFEIQVDNTVSAGTVLEFELSVNDQIITGGPWISNFSFPIAPLTNGTIVLGDDGSPDSNGDSDGIPEPGETIEILPTLNNVSDHTIAEVKGTLTCEQSFINIWNAVNGASGYVHNNYQYNMISNVPTPIESGATNVQPAFDFVFDYPISNPLQELNFNLVVEGKLDNSNGTLMKWTTTTVYNEDIEASPLIESTLPIDDAIDIAVESDFKITFDKDVIAVAGKYIYIYETGGAIVNTIEATNAQVSIVSAIVTINPTNDLLGVKDYYIIIDNGAFTDNSGNAFEGIDTPIKWSFTTIQNNLPATPLNLTATAISDYEVELTWEASVLAENYQVLSCNESITYTTSTTETSFLVNGLTQLTTYEFAVKASNSVGTSGASACAAATTFCMHPWGETVIYTNSTVAYGIVTIEGEPASENDIVGVFVDEECRGVEAVVINDGIAYVTINVQGETKDEIFNFKVWDASECSNLNVNLTSVSKPGNSIGSSPDYLPIAVIACESSSDSVNSSICIGEVYAFGNQALTVAGTYTETFISESGCDSVITLTLNVLPAYSETVEASICEGDSYSFGTQTLSTTGTFSEIFTSQGGCDSIVNLSLTLNPSPYILAVCDKNSIFVGEEAMVTVTYADTIIKHYYTPASDTLIVFEATNEFGCYNADYVNIYIEKATAISQMKVERINIYPTPASSEVSIVFDRMQSSVDVIIVDVNGKQVDNLHFYNSKHLKLDVSGFFEGVYVLNIQTKEGNSQHRISIIK